MRLLKQAAIVAALMFGLAITAVAIAPVAAFAQDVTVGAIPEASFTQQLLAAILPALGLVITALLTWAANELHKRTGIEIEAKHRAALQSALMNGILFALQKSGWVSGQPITPTIMATARSYVESSVPDALRKFDIDPAAAAGQAILDRLLTPKLPVALGTVMPNGDTLVGPAFPPRR